MRYSTLKEEKKLWEKGFWVVAGIDEAGRGPLAGPVVAAAVALLQKRVSNFDIRISDLKLRDSKQLSAKQREYWYNIFSSHAPIQWGVGIVSEKIIDKINILQATKLAMELAVRNLEKKLRQNSQYSNFCYSRKHYIIDFLILDGNFTLDHSKTPGRFLTLGEDPSFNRPHKPSSWLPPQKSIVKGDEKVFSCALASIIAKVTRDRMMVRYHKKYPQYGFDRHKGYGTKLHLQMLKRYGPCPMHRKSFAPVSVLKSEIRISKSETNPKFKSSKF